MYGPAGCVTFHSAGACVRAHACVSVRDVIYLTLLGQGLSLLAKPPFLFLSSAVSLLLAVFYLPPVRILNCSPVCILVRASARSRVCFARVFSYPQHKLIIFISSAVVPQTTGQISQSFHRLK